MSEKKRLTLTGNKMPADVYLKLDKLGKERKLTPYICSLIEKEEMMDNLINNLSLMLDKLNAVEKKVVDLNEKIENTTIQAMPLPEEKLIVREEIVQEGKLEITSQIEGGIEEEVFEPDF